MLLRDSNVYALTLASVLLLAARDVSGLLKLRTVDCCDSLKVGDGVVVAGDVSPSSWSFFD